MLYILVTFKALWHLDTNGLWPNDNNLQLILGFELCYSYHGGPSGFSLSIWQAMTGVPSCMQGVGSECSLNPPHRKASSLLARCTSFGLSQSTPQEVVDDLCHVSTDFLFSFFFFLFLVSLCSSCAVEQHGEFQSDFSEHHACRFISVNSTFKYLNLCKSKLLQGLNLFRHSFWLWWETSNQLRSLLRLFFTSYLKRGILNGFDCVTAAETIEQPLVLQFGFLSCKDIR